MRKFIWVNLIAASAALFALPASAEIWNLDFDNGVNADGTPRTFAGDTIFSDIGNQGGWTYTGNGNWERVYTPSDNWQRYDGEGNAATNNDGTMSGRGNPSDGGIPGSYGVNVKIDVWNARKDGVSDSYSNGYYYDSGQPGFAVGFDTTNQNSRDNDLEAPFYATATESQTSGYGNVLIIQEHKYDYLKDCGGGRLSGGNGICKHQTHGHSKADDEAKGGDIVFDFGEEVTLLKMNVFDIEESGGKVKFDTDGDGYYDESVDIEKTVHNHGYWGNADNGVGLLTFNGDVGIKAHKMMVWLPGSGAIDNIMGITEKMSSVSEPSVLALFGVGLFAIGVYRRRREETTATA